MGTDLLLEDSPGNFTVEKSDKSVIIRVYDATGRAMLIEQPLPKADKQGGGETRSSAPRVDAAAIECQTDNVGNSREPTAPGLWQFGGKLREVLPPGYSDTTLST